MKKFAFALLALSALAACSSKPPVETAATTPAPVVAPEPSMAQVTLKPIKGKKVSGLIHFTQDINKVKAQATIEGLKSGPYTMQVSDITDCKKVSINKNQRQLGEVIADRKGVIKTNLDLVDVSTQDLTGKTLVLQTNAKKSAKIVACGLVETMK